MSKPLTFKNTVEMGNYTEEYVQKKLWRYGYSVKRMKRINPFDLLVNETIRVEVKSATYQLHEDGGYHWRVGKPLGDRFDVCAIVLLLPVGKPLIRYFTREEISKNIEDGAMSIHIIANSPDEPKIGNKSPLKVLGKPYKSKETK